MRRTSLHTWADDNDLNLAFAWYNNGFQFFEHPLPPYAFCYHMIR